MKLPTNTQRSLLRNILEAVRLLTPRVLVVASLGRGMVQVLFGCFIEG